MPSTGSLYILRSSDRGMLVYSISLFCLCTLHQIANRDIAVLNDESTIAVTYVTVYRLIWSGGKSSSATSIKQPREFSTTRLQTVVSSVIPDVGHRRTTVEPLFRCTTSVGRPAPRCSSGTSPIVLLILAGSVK